LENVSEFKCQLYQTPHLLNSIRVEYNDPSVALQCDVFTVYEVRALCSGVRIPVDLWMYVGSFLGYRTVQCAALRRLNLQPMETI